jgi:hypothetical protein
MPDSLIGAEVEELESLVELTQVRGWRVVRRLLSEHRGRCLDQVYAHLKKHEDRKAGEWLAKSDLYNLLVTLIQNRKTELSKRKENE